MERDFLGLSSKESLSLVKEEMNNDNGYNDSVNSVNRPHAVKMFSVPNQAISVSMGHPSLKNLFATVGQNMNGASVKQPLLGRIPVTVPHSFLPIVEAVSGMTETCVKPSVSAPKLTIFYAGTVIVFDDISPEKLSCCWLGVAYQLLLTWHTHNQIMFRHPT